MQFILREVNVSVGKHVIEQSIRYYQRWERFGISRRGDYETGFVVVPLSNICRKGSTTER